MVGQMLGKTWGKWERKRKVWENWGKNDGGSMIYEEIVNGFEIEKGSTNVE